MTEDERGRLWALVDHLGYDLEPSIIIGGWATHLRVGGELSTDIDLIIKSPDLRQKLRDVLHDYSESTHHSGGGRKVRGEIDGIHIDAYIPHESNLGNTLRLDVSRLAQYTDEKKLKGWLLLTLEAHIVTKIAALLDRPATEKGDKDAREIFRLMRDDSHPANSSEVVRIMLDSTTGPKKDVPAHLRTVFELLPTRAGLNKAERRWLDGVRREWVDEAEFQLRKRQIPDR